MQCAILGLISERGPRTEQRPAPPGPSNKARGCAKRLRAALGRVAHRALGTNSGRTRRRSERGRRFARATARALDERRRLTDFDVACAQAAASRTGVVGCAAHVPASAGLERAAGAPGESSLARYHAAPRAGAAISSEASVGEVFAAGGGQGAILAMRRAVGERLLAGTDQIADVATARTRLAFLTVYRAQWRTIR